MNTHVAEIQLAGRLNKWFDKDLLPPYSQWDRQNREADPIQCGRYRPDFLWDIEEEQRIVILECDEHAHRTNVVRCEFSRPIAIALGFGGRPVSIIRYNPDMLPNIKTMPSKQEREALLLSRMQAALAPAPPDDSCFRNILTVEFLYYFDIPGSVVAAPYVQKIAFKGETEYETWAMSTITKLEGESHRKAERVTAANSGH